MIDKSSVKQLAEEWLQGQDYFLVDVIIGSENRIVVEIDHAEGVWIEDCVALSRFIESRLDREVEDYELEVGSAGIGQPFKVLEQYICHIGKPVEVLTREGKKLSGTLKSAEANSFVLITQRKEKIEGQKRPILVDEEITLSYDQVQYTKYQIIFK